MAVDRNNPTEIARETFRLLAQRRVPPTPANFERLYHEVAGSSPQEAFPARRLKTLAAGLPRNTPEAARTARRVEQCVAKGDWDAFAGLITELCAGEDRETLQWGPVIRELVGEYERTHHGLTAARKREALQHVLTSTADAATLHQRIGGLIKGWRHHQSEAAVDDDTTAEADTGCAKIACNDGFIRGIGIGAYAQAFVFVGQLHQRSEVPAEFGVAGLDLPFDHFAGGSIERDPVAFFVGVAVDRHGTGFIIYMNGACTGYTTFPHTTRHYGSV